MMLARTFALMLAAAVAGAVTVIACGDDSPIDADAAAVCDCPAAEPPLEGRIRRVETNGSIPLMDDEVISAGCETGEVLLSGGCFLPSVFPDVVLISAGSPTISPGAWSCAWKNPTTNAVPAVAVAMCLTPAE